ncbi:MAG: undecaprenyl-diphosphatase [Gammaproteobacteria bacterium]|jgi:undecaprenyl-diphosphatase|nr:undecaprenyl-diphosphatase [Gammaproteobacteria bacterium]
MTLLNIIILAIVQGLAELLPVSSSAHVVVAEKLLGLDPSSPPMTLLLVMLHTGTMFAVIVYFWRQWQAAYFQSTRTFKTFAVRVIVATALTAVIGEAIIKIIEMTVLRAVPHSEIEDLFGHLEFIAPALAAVGLLILGAGIVENRRSQRAGSDPHNLTLQRASVIGMIQGLCLPFRGFSRSGATISAGMLMGLAKSRAEAFSFALAVVITPPVVVREVLRLVRLQHVGGGDLSSFAFLSVFGAFVAFIAGLLALKWLSRWLETGRWYLFGIYCLVAAGGVALLHHAGY